jgi:acyl-CoA synthetase (AMP-forming)/AMP-acid ligase II
MGQSRERSVSLVARSMHLAREAAVLVRSGVLAPAAPHRVYGQLWHLFRYGPTLAGAFGSAAVRAPRRCAVQDETASRTFAELDSRVKAISRGLAGLGIGPQDCVAVLGRNGVAFVEALVAINRTGADALLLNTFLSPPQAREVLRRERPRLVFADADLLGLLDEAPADTVVVTLRPGRTSSTGQPLPEDPPTPKGQPIPKDLPAPKDRLTLEELAATGGPELPPSGRRGRLVVLTSGTTGTPKGARRPAPTSLSPAASMLSRLRLRRGDTLMIACPLFHTWGLGLLQIAPALAATVVLRERADPEVVLEAVDRSRCTALGAVPVILERILHLPDDVRGRYDTSRLRVVGSSGSALTREVATRFQDVFGDVLYNVYGSTEISWATIATPEDLRAAAGTAGRPPLGTRLEIVDEYGQPVPRGQIGRIFVGNELLFEGYSNGTSKEQVHGLMATGDRGFLDPGGRLMVVGRDDDLIISGAEKIYPLEVEEVILALPGVREVVVVGRPDAELGQRLIAYVVCVDGVRLTPEQVKDHVRQRLARFAVPKEVGFLDHLPRNATGKVVPRLLPRTVPGAEELPLE